MRWKESGENPTERKRTRVWRRTRKSGLRFSCRVIEQWALLSVQFLVSDLTSELNGAPIFVIYFLYLFAFRLLQTFISLHCRPFLANKLRLRHIGQSDREREMAKESGKYQKQWKQHKQKTTWTNGTHSQPFGKSSKENFSNLFYLIKW